jgi:hypothetical protein
MPQFMATRPIEMGRGTCVGRVLIEGATVQIPDVESDPEFTFTEATKLGGPANAGGGSDRRDRVVAPHGAAARSLRHSRQYRKLAEMYWALALGEERDRAQPSKPNVKRNTT